MGLKRRILGFFTFLFITIFSAHAMAVEYPFIMTTTPDTTKFSFQISAAGTFYIDWGDGNTGTINKTTTSEQTISHTYTSAKSYTIKLGGQATGYSDSMAIYFYKTKQLASIDGSLGRIFSTLSNKSQPRFGNDHQGTFYSCTNLTGSIPENLFNEIDSNGKVIGITGAPTKNMFMDLFNNSGITGPIPENLFTKFDTNGDIIGGITGEPTQNLFYGTFGDCTKLTGNIPPKLFHGIQGPPADYMFQATFYNCPNLTGSIHKDLFKGIQGAPATYMFWLTFGKDSSLTGTIPSDLFSGIHGTPAPGMFHGTFYGCLGLSGTIPADLFANISGKPAEYMFRETFSKCSGLSGYIPPELFSNIDTPDVATANDQMSSIFYNSGIVTQCPVGYYQYMTGFEEYFDSRVSCTPCPARYTNAGPGLTSESQCVMTVEPGYYIENPGDTEPTICPAGSYCAGGDVPYGGTGPINACPTNSNSSAGASSCTCNTGYNYNGGTITTKNACVANTYTLTLDRNGAASGDTTATIQYGANGFCSAGSKTDTTCSLNIYTPYKTGYRFNGYFTEQTGGTMWIDNNGYPVSSTIITSSRTLYAQYTANKYNCPAGEYLSGTSCVTCPAGSYCPGVTKQEYTGGDIGVITCPENSSSEPGASVCTCNPGFINNGGTTTTTDACIPDYKFFMTTTPDTTEFSFAIDAAGTFYIDWGDGKTETIEKAHIGEQNVSHTYSSANEYIIKLGGQATGYGNDMAISFYRNKKLSRLDGCLGTIFSTLSNGSQPRFGNAYDSTIGQYYGAFTDCINLTQIPGTLFTTFDTNGSIIGGINGAPIPYMFAYTFSGCSGLTSIPDRLFAGLIGKPAEYMFYNTFGYFSYYDGTPHSSNCSNITGSIPENLFAGIKGAPARSMFDRTFEGCSGLSGSIPENLFAGVSGAPASYMFFYTFYGCSGLSGNIPENLFAGITGAPAEYMFYYTFYGCSGLTGSIPENLFAGISGAPASYMFSQTFYGCSGLTGSIPENLFAGVSGAPKSSMFNGTFRDCSGLTGNIPENLFARIKGAPANNMFENTFSGCSNLSGPIPQGLFGNISGDVTPLMFSGTFFGCSNLSGNIPAGLFGNLSGTPQYSMFKDTFSGCSGLTGSIPAGLFGNLSGTPFAFMFEGTFKDCSNLTGSIPDDLFSNISGTPQYKMFDSTFAGCSNLESFIPPTLFAGIDTPDIATEAYQMSSVFANSGIVTQCPVGYYQYMTGFEEYFDSRVSCTPCPAGYTNAGSGLTSESQCVMTVKPGYYIENPGDTTPIICPTGSYCAGGDVPYGSTGPINTCPAMTNTYGAYSSDISTMDQNDNDVIDSIEECVGNRWFFEKKYIDFVNQSYNEKVLVPDAGYEPDSDANKRGTYLTACHYNINTNEYDVNCYGEPGYYGCAGGYYFPNAYLWDVTEEDANVPYIKTDTLAQAIEQICVPAEENHWSPGISDCYTPNASTENVIACMENKTPQCQLEPILVSQCVVDTFYEQHACPENSSTRGLTGQEYCVCDDGYTVDGTANGATTTMYDACIKAEIILTYDVNGANGAVAQQTCPAGSPCDIKTPSQIGHDMYRPGYVFNGWALNENDTTPIDYQYTFNENTTVYAIWTPCANGTYKTADANAGEQCSACSDLGTEYTSSDIASTSANQCRTECVEYSVVYGTAIPLEQYEFWPNKCEYRGESETGNPCDIIDGVCVEKSCNYDYEMVNGRCQPCNRENALTYKPTGNCVVATCGYGYHADGQYCVGDTKECSAPNAISAHQVWDTNKNAFSECLITECESGYHVSENVCQLDDQTCELEHGFGEREWDDQTNSWGKCVATYCEPGYTNDPDQTNESWEQCGRCNNMYTTDGIMAVSSYVQGCEIASCMNQGEQFILDGNECRLICDEYSDETGRRYWDGKKCVHECAGGYTQW